MVNGINEGERFANSTDALEKSIGIYSFVIAASVTSLILAEAMNIFHLFELSGFEFQELKQKWGGLRPPHFQFC